MSMSETMALSDRRTAQPPEPRPDQDGPEAPPKQDAESGQQQPPKGGAPEAPPRKMRPGPFRLLIVVAAAALAGLAFWGISKRSAATQQTQNVANQAAVTRVDVRTPEKGPGSVQLDLPGQTQAYTQAPIYAQTNGYLKKWHFDIGAQVKTGDLLAEIDTPQVDQQLDQARATLKEAQAALELSRVTYQRDQELFKTHVIAAQDLDNAAGDFRVKQATVGADEAAVRSLEALENFKMVRAPFDGIVTARNTDLGALIVSGTGTPLFIVAKNSPLRVYVNVPESLAPYIHPGVKAELTFASFPNRQFPGAVVNTAGAIDPNSRTLLTEIQIPNPTGELFPGAYAMARLQTEGSPNALTVPASALLFRSEGPAVATVDGGSKVRIRKVQVRRDLGNKLEVEGVTATDRVIINPGDGLSDGMTVEVNAPQTEQKG
ncbi:MAG: efflux RND transporter periplasmic adaptor subunit [Verrucomicrobia bacterium]|nr:efflux RND transporter periplasmic adaptor subunit [Verrucomicrobiota bacterium]